MHTHSVLWLSAMHRYCFQRNIKRFLFSRNHTKAVSFLSGCTKDSNNTINKAVSDAEKIVGFPTSYLSLRALLSDELSAVALHIRKLARTKHPLLTTARGILFDSKHNVQGRGLVVLLLSKVMNQKENKLTSSEAFNRQRTLAELTELIHTAFLVHRGIVDINTLLENAGKTCRPEMELGNKMAVLSGDFLLANACVALSELNNSKVVNLMSDAISDMSQGYFILPESGEHSRLSSLDDLPGSIEEWQNAMYFAHGSLLSNACRSAAQLTDHGDDFGDLCAKFGKHMILAQQARIDVQRITKGNNNNNGKLNIASSELCALPVVIKSQENGGKNWMKNFLIKDDDDADRMHIMKEKLCSDVSCCQSALKKSEEICTYHRNNALSALKQLPAGEARKSLEILTEAFSRS